MQHVDRRRTAFVLVVLACLATAGGCAGFGGHEEPGPAAGSVPARAGRTALDNAARPSTWAPLLAAVALHATGADERLLRWAEDNRPVYRSAQSAETDGDRLRDLISLTALGAALVPRPEPTGAPWAVRPAVTVASVLAADAAANELKEVAGRRRPTGGNSRSFPSGDSTRAAASARAGERNLHGLVPKAAMRPARALLAGAAGLVAWARVEAGVHFPSDALAGYALGSFVAATVHDTVLGAPSIRTTFRPRAAGGWELVIGGRF